MSPKQLHIIRHSLGLRDDGTGRQYRNHFVTGPGSDDYADCCALVEAGYMRNRGSSVLTGGDPLFTVTEAGVAAIEATEPQPSRDSLKEQS
jgi:hypothetical protein